MPLFDFLKRKEEVQKAKEKQPEKKPAGLKTPQPAAPVKATAKKQKSGKFAFEAVNTPHISEKATYLSEQNQYIFKVSPNYNKPEIKKAVEGIYGVDVLSVNIVKIPAKRRRIGRSEGFKKGFVKAVVRIKEGQKIEIL